MKNYRRLMIVAMALSISAQGSIQALATTNNDSTNVLNNAVNSITGSIDVYIRFDNNETKEELENRNIIVNLLNENSTINEEIALNDGSYIEVDGVVSAWKYTFANISAGDNTSKYSLKFTGDGHRDFEVADIDLSVSSKSVVVGTGDGTFAYGDLNADKNIDDNDIAILENQIKEAQEENVNESNDTKLIEYTKLVSLVKKVGKQDSSDNSNIVFSTNLVNPSSVVAVAEDIAQLEEVATIDGEFENIFNTNNSEVVTITAKEGESSISIPITIAEENGLEISEIAITSVGEGSINSGVAEVEYLDENGEIQVMHINFGEDATRDNSVVVVSAVEENITSASARTMNMSVNEDNNVAIITNSEENANNTVVISLGTRVVVKKISVTVEVDEDNNFVVLQEVKFVQDIVPENPYASDGLIENLKAVGGDKFVTLTWDMAENVAGYKVSYGTSSGRYDNFSNVTTNTATISLSENLIINYFVVQSTYDEWIGAESSEVTAMGIPSSVPSAPTSISVTEMDKALVLSWTAGKDALTHNVYIREQGTEEYEKIATSLISCNYSIGSLENDKTYEIVISGTNSRGEGAKSAVAEGTPFKLTVDGPILHTHNRMPNSNIIKVGMRDSSNYDSSIYPNGYSPNYIYDEDYATYWQSKNWYSNSNFDIDFEQPMTMNYVVWVPNITSTAYATSLAEYNIAVKTVENPEGYTVVYNTEDTYNETVDVYYDENGIAYCVLPFEKTENITTLTVGVWIKDGGARPATLSEIVCYEYDPIEEDISALFNSGLKIELENGVTLEQIDELETRLENLENFVVRKSILQAELDLAKALLQGDKTALGYVKDDFVKIDTSNDLGSKGSSISPLGWVSLARYDNVVYADIPEGETLTIYPSQFYNSAGEAYSTANAVEIKNGRNIINTPDLTNISGLIEGGQWYYSYSGDNVEDVAMHFFKDIGIYQGVDYTSDSIVTPTLELYNYDVQDDKDVIMEKIKQYIEDLDAYTSNVIVDTTHPNYNIFNWSTNASNNPLNTTEISLRHTLLSLTVTGVNGALGNGTVEERAEKLYNAIQSWEAINYVTNRVYGDTIVDGISTRAGRQNVRVMRMSATAFMYAGGNHIGIQYGSASSMLPTSSNIHPNNLGWGIAHEIGHNLDRIGILEVTNNIYSMAVATYNENGEYTPLNRIPWSTVFSKTSSGATGSSADIFAQLGMYWQLHIAYADKTDVLDYYSNVFGAYNDGSYTGSNKFEVLASKASGKDLTDFFTAWGTNLSDEAKAEMAKLEKEDRKLQYMSEESIQLRFNGAVGMDKQSFTATANVSKQDDQTVVLTADYNLSDSELEMLQGFEVYRDGALVGFTQDGVYEDYFGSMNNKSISYAMVMIDKLGNVVSDKVNAEDVRIEYDVVIDKNLYTVEVVDEDTLKVVFEEETSASGFRFANDFPVDGEFTVDVAVYEYEYDENGELIANTDNPLVYNTVKESDFSKNEVNSDEKFINYFIKQGAEADDTRIGTYDAKEILIKGTGVSGYKDNLDIIAYVGDNISFTDYVIGRLSHDFDMGGDIIEAGTIIVVGEYVGDPYFNEITVEGRYVKTILTDDGVSEQSSYDVMVAGDTYMFATVPEDKVVSTISDGLFIFIPEVQEDHTSSNCATSCDHSSLFPTYMRGLMTRNDSSGNARMTTYTSWTHCPSFDTIPEIVIE